MGIRAHHVAATLFSATVLLATAAWFGIRVPSAEATCGTGSSVVISSLNSGSGSQPFSGIRALKAYSTPSAASGMSFTLIGPNPIPLGEATQKEGGWQLAWDTRNVANGTYQLLAVAHFGTATTLDCASPAVSVQISNQPTQAPTLAASITPGNWQGKAGSSGTFTLDTLYTDQFGRASHVTSTSTNQTIWQASIGSLNKTTGPSVVLQAGTKAGNGTLTADVNYQGLVAQASAPIKVLAATAFSNATTPTATPAPSPSATPAASAPGATATTAGATRLAAMPTIFRPTTVTNSNPTVGIPTLSCLEKKIGQAKFSEISSGQTQPSTAERRLASECFSRAEPIPAILAPIAPSHIEELEQTSGIVSLASIKNTTITNAAGKKISGLLLKGKGAPGSSIFIYVFSDPLVLRAETDSQGTWSYVLENPLAAGNHEVYAVAEKDASSFVRTAAIPISIAAAAPDASDGNLLIERQWSTAQIGFTTVAVLLVFAAIGVVFTLLRRRRGAGGSFITAQAAAPLIQPTSTPVAVPSKSASSEPK